MDLLDEKDQVKDQMSLEQIGELFAADNEEFPKDFPLSYKEIQHRQKDDPDLQKLLRDKPKYVETTFPFGDVTYTLVTKDNKIVLPKALQKTGVEWYHTMLMHPGETRTELMMGQHYTWKGMRKTVEAVCQRCQSCQLTKPKQQCLGHLPPKIPEEVPWECLCIDLIGPYTIGSKGKSTQTTLHCLTMIDPATGWFEITEIPAKMADVVINVLETTEIFHANLYGVITFCDILAKFQS